MNEVELQRQIREAKKEYVDAKEAAENAMLNASYMIERRNEAGRRLGVLRAKLKNANEPEAK